MDEVAVNIMYLKDFLDGVDGTDWDILAEDNSRFCPVWFFPDLIQNSCKTFFILVAS
jgi:hypothetical protein